MDISAEKYTLLHKGRMKRIFEYKTGEGKNQTRHSIELGSILDEGLDGVTSPELVVDRAVLDGLEKEDYFKELVKAGDIIVFNGVRK